MQLRELFGLTERFLNFDFAVLFVVCLVQGKKDSSSSSETDYDNASFFIDSVHSVASEVAKVMYKQ